jgi:type VI protein secretion system component Hcp
MEVIAFTEIPRTNRKSFKLVVTKLVDKGSPTLRLMLNNEEVAANAILTIYTPGLKLGSSDIIMIEMHNVSIRSMNTLIPENAEKLTESVAIIYESGLWSYIPSGPDGSKGDKISVGYDIKKNTKN